MKQTDKDSLDTWAILELMGHRKLAGRVTEEEHFGVVLMRIDVPKNDTMITQFYGGNTIYCITPTTEEIVRAFAAKAQPKPIYRYELDLALPSAEKDDGSDLEFVDSEDDLEFAEDDLPF